MRIHHAIGEFRLYKNQYQVVMDLLEREMEDSPFDLVVTDCTEDSYYVSIIPGIVSTDNNSGCKCGGKCKHHTETSDAESKILSEQMMQLVNYIVETPILSDMYESFLETENQKKMFKSGLYSAVHVAKFAHLVFDRTITSLLETISDKQSEFTINTDQHKIVSSGDSVKFLQ